MFRCYLTAEWIATAKTSGRMFSNVTLMRLIWLINNPVSGVTALQKALVMMQISGRTLQVSVSVLIFIFPFECHSESSAIVFQVSCYVCILGFSVHESANLENAQRSLLSHTT